MCYWAPVRERLIGVVFFVKLLIGVGLAPSSLQHPFFLTNFVGIRAVIILFFFFFPSLEEECYVSVPVFCLC